MYVKGSMMLSMFYTLLVHKQQFDDTKSLTAFIITTVHGVKIELEKNRARNT